MNGKSLNKPIFMSLFLLPLIGCAMPLNFIPFNQEGYSESDPFGIQALKQLEVKVSEIPQHTTNTIDGKLEQYVKKSDLADGLNVDELEASKLVVDGKNVSVEGHTHSVNDLMGWEEVSFQFNNMDVKQIKVDGKNVSLDGHEHVEYISKKDVVDAANIAIQGINNATNVFQIQQSLIEFMQKLSK